VARLGQVLVGDPASADRNPIDLTLANLKSETYRDTLTALAESPRYDAIVVVVGSSGLGDPTLAAEPVRVAAAASEKPVLVYCNPHALNMVSYLNSVGVPAFATAEGCAAALVALRRMSSPRRATMSRVDALSTDLSHLPIGQLDEAQSLALFARFGIP